MDACCFHDNTIIKQLYLRNLRSPAHPGQKKYDVAQVRRYMLLLEELESDNQEKPAPNEEDGYDYTLLYRGLELPRINYDEHTGKLYRCVEASHVCRWKPEISAGLMGLLARKQ